MSLSDSERKIIESQELHDKYQEDLKRFETVIAQDKGVAIDQATTRQSTTKLSEYECPSITAMGLSIAVAAFDIFQGAGCSADFCFQDVTDEPSFCSVFGGFNRLRFSAKPRPGGGCWDYSKSHCSEDFAAHCESLGIPAS